MENLSKWQDAICKLADGKSAKIQRESVVIGVNVPFGTISRDGETISFTPAKRKANKGLEAFTASMDQAAEKLAEFELLSAFSF